jgi:hypothetical protein
MALGTAHPGSPDPARSQARPQGRVIEYQQYIDDQLGRTRRRVKWVDLATSLTVLTIGVVVYAVAAAVIDHWVVPGGLGFVGRLILLLGLLGGIAAFVVTNLLPLVLRKVSPVYAAAAIEQGGTMKNTLINFLLLRKQPAGVADGLLDAMKEQAAVRLSKVPADAPVDRTSLLRWSWVLAAVLVAAIGYGLGSPKNAFLSFRRVLFPWAPIAAPTRVHIESLEPGTVDRPRDDVVPIRVRTTGLRSTDTVVLYVSATGNPADDVPVPMQSDDGNYLWKATLPAGGEGLKQDLHYYVQAGDIASPRHRIRVLQTPVINVRAVRYDYPVYTGLPPRIVERQGDVKALEGTRVTLSAEANQPIRAAHVAFDQVRKKDVELRPDGLAAVGGFDLLLNKDRTTPQHTSYVLRFTNEDGAENPKPVEYKIEVTPDQPPELRIVEPNSPASKELSLPLGGLLRVTLAARDPDFQLAELTVVLERGNSLLREEKLLPEPRSGEFSNTLLVNAERFNLRVGEKFTFRGRAADDKFPQPNVVETPRYTVVVTPPTGEQPPQNRGEGRGERGEPKQPPSQNQPANQEQGNRKPGGAEDAPQQNPQPSPADGKPSPNEGPPQNRGEGAGEKGQQKPAEQPNQPGSPEKGNGEPGNREQRSGEKQPAGERANSGENKKPEDPIDPNVDPGKAFEELKKHYEEQERKEEQKSNEKNPSSGGEKSNEDSASGGRESAGSEKSSQPRDPQNNASQKSGSNEGKQPSPEATEKKDNGSQPPGTNGQSGRDKPQDGKPGGNEKSPDGGSSGAGQQQTSGGEKSNGNEANRGRDPAGGPGSEGSASKNQPGREQPGKPGEQSPQPGGEQGTKSPDGTQPPRERGNGTNEDGREAGRKPADDPSSTKNGDAVKPRDPNDRTQQGTGSEQPGKPNDNAGEKQPGTESAGERGTGNPKSQPRPGEKPNAGETSPQGNAGRNDAGDGAQSGGASAKPDPKQPRAGEKPGEQPAEGKPSVNEGQPAGDNKQPGGNEGPAPNNEGSPGQQETAKPRDKTGKPSTGNQQESTGDKTKSPGAGKHESDTQGDTSGDRAGNGEEGGGMKSPQKGTGAAGQNQASDQGGGTANESGDQAASNQGGDKTRGNDPSQGKPSGRPGEGTQTNNAGEKSGGNPPSTNEANRGREPAEQPAPPNGNRSPNDRGGDERQGGPQGNSGGGIPNDQQTPSSRDPGTIAPPADEANLDYAKKVTDLTLERLKQQLDKGEVDPELLKRFTSPDALKDFVNRWDAMRKSAREPGVAGEQARKQLQENLKGLGLRSGTTSQQGATGGGDDFRAVRGGRRSEPPAKYADQYRAYTTGVGQGEK